MQFISFIFLIDLEKLIKQSSPSDWEQLSTFAWSVFYWFSCVSQKCFFCWFFIYLLFNWLLQNTELSFIWHFSINKNINKEIIKKTDKHHQVIFNSGIRTLNFAKRPISTSFIKIDSINKGNRKNPTTLVLSLFFILIRFPSPFCLLRLFRVEHGERFSCLHLLEFGWISFFECVFLALFQWIWNAFFRF
jgi:hypothetical protein